MSWKIVHIETGRTLKAGFSDEEGAKDWLETRSRISEEDYTYEEMDVDEEDEQADQAAQEAEEGFPLEEDLGEDPEESDSEENFTDLQSLVEKEDFDEDEGY